MNLTEDGEGEEWVKAMHTVCMCVGSMYVYVCMCIYIYTRV